jgi:cytochrome P450
MNTNPSDPVASIPGPRGHFLLGSIPAIRHDRVQFLVDLRRDFGDVVRIRLGPVGATLIFHPDAIQRVLLDNHRNYSKETPTFANLRLLVGNALVVSSGDFWLRQRRLMQPAYHRNEIHALSEMIVQETRMWLDRLEGATGGGQTINIAHKMMNLTLEVTTLALFGSRVQDVDRKLGETISFLMRDTVFRFEHPFYPPIWVPARRNRDFNAALKRLDDVIYGILAERRAHPRGRNNLLDIMMKAQLEEETGTGGGPQRLTNKQLRDEIVEIFLAGHDTTAATLCWTLYLLSKHPDVEAKLRRELDEVLGGRQPALADLPRLEYTGMVRDESMRLYPPAWLTERRAVAEDVLCGYRIPAGTILGISQFVTHRHPGFWENPDTFDPERFTPERSADRHDFAFFPFGGGPRQCLGKHLALLETHLTLAMLLQRFRFELEPGWQVTMDPQLSLGLKGGLRMRLTAA